MVKPFNYTIHLKMIGCGSGLDIPKTSSICFNKVLLIWTAIAWCSRSSVVSLWIALSRPKAGLLHVTRSTIKTVSATLKSVLSWTLTLRMADSTTIVTLHS